MNNQVFQVIVFAKEAHLSGTLEEFFRSLSIDDLDQLVEKVKLASSILECSSQVAVHLTENKRSYRMMSIKELERILNKMKREDESAAQDKFSF